MSDTNLEVFIENIKETTTVLQQLTICIKNLKTVLSRIDELEGVKPLYIHNVLIDVSTDTSEYDRLAGIALTIINDSETEFTNDTLLEYISSNTNYTNSKVLKVNGWCDYDDDKGYAYCLGYNAEHTRTNIKVSYNEGLDQTIIYIDDSVLEDTTATTITDNVIEL